MAEQRIINAPTAEDYTNDSYVLIDGQTNGTRKILISNILKPPEPDYIYKWDFTESLTDSVQGRAVTLSNQNIYVEGVGLVFNNTSLSYVYFTNINYMTTIVEIDIATMSKQFSSNSHGRFIMIDDTNGFIFRKSNYNNWQVYGEKNNSSSWRTYEQTSNNPDIFSGKTLKLKFNNSSDMEIYADNELVYKGEPFTDLNQEKGFFINSSAGQGFYNMTITGVRIYANEGV